jgi:hypothetical protein
VPPQLGDRVKARALALADNPSEKVLQPTQTAASTLKRRSVIREFTALAVAGLFALGVYVWLLNQSTSVAYAQAIQQLTSSAAFRYTNSVYVADKNAPIDSHVWVAADGRERREIGDVVSISDPAGMPRLTLLQSSKKAIVNDTPIKIPDVSPAHWLLQLKSRGDHPDKELGESTKDNRRCFGFSVNIGQSVYAIWTDAATNDLVQIEFTGMPKGSPVVKSVMHDFQFDQQFDESLFSTSVPEGYSLIPSVKPLEPIEPEQSLVEALQGYTKLSDGKFPKSIADAGEWAVFLSNTDTSSENMLGISSRLGYFLPFLTMLPKDDYDYLGDGKSTHDPKSIVFWYRKDGKLRAIFNDLKIVDISEKDLPSKTDQ